ncbi:MAG: hypothetical protein ABI693_03170 [Bryobacteraceae bacterium]
MKQLLDHIEELWCVNMHGELMWPIHGSYQCGVCHRHYPVPFAAQPVQQSARQIS